MDGRTLAGVIVLGLVVASLLFVPASAERPGWKRVIAHTTDQGDLDNYKAKGCEVVRVLKRTTALRCPAAVADELGLEEDLVVTIVDLSADRQISADAVWTLGYTGEGRRIAVLDTGIAYNHPELSTSYLAGRDFVNNDADPADDNGHGTHVAGIITADGMDARARGVAPGAAIVAGKVLDGSGSGYLSDTVAAIYWAVDGPDGVYGTGDEFNVDAISMSLGTSPPYVYKTESCDSVYPEMSDAINYAVGRGVAVVAAAGNSGGSGVSIPGCMRGAIAVGAVDGKDKIASFSGRGKSLDIVAPGVGMYSTWLNGGYATASGTSMATPVVSATVALIKQKNPGYDAAGVRAALYNGARDLGKRGYDTTYGWGRVDALGAVGQ